MSPSFTGRRCLPPLPQPDLRDRFLKPRQRPFPGDALAQLQHQAGFVIPERPRDVGRRRRPEHRVHPQPGGALLGFLGLRRLVVLDGPAQHGRPPGTGRALPLRQELALDPVGVRMPAFSQEQFGLPLGHHVPGRQADCGQTASLPHAGRTPASSWAARSGVHAARWPSPTITPRKR